MNIQDEMRRDIKEYYRNVKAAMEFVGEHPEAITKIRSFSTLGLSEIDYQNAVLDLIADIILKDYPIEIKQMGANV